jgi:hypothetical protein
MCCRKCFPEGGRCHVCCGKSKHDVPFTPITPTRGNASGLRKTTNMRLPPVRFIVFYNVFWNCELNNSTFSIIPAPGGSNHTTFSIIPAPGGSKTTNVSIIPAPGGSKNNTFSIHSRAWRIQKHYVFHHSRAWRLQKCLTIVLRLSYDCVTIVVRLSVNEQT